jgi:hypothetical protein
MVVAGMSIESTLTKRFITDIKTRLAAAQAKGHGSIKLELPDAEILIGMADERLAAIIDAEHDDAVSREMAGVHLLQAAVSMGGHELADLSADTGEAVP